MFSNIYYENKKNKIHLWEYINGQRIYDTFDYIPYCYLYDVNGDYQDILGKKCKRKEFNTWYDQKNFIKKCNTLEGDINPEDRILIDRYYALKEEFPKLHIHYIDIETTSEKGFPQISLPEEEILLISIYSTQTGKIHSFGTRDYTPKEENIEYNYFDTEEELLKGYFKWHRGNYPDIITGWNIYYFDIPYILERTKKILNNTFINRYSPVSIIREDFYSNRRGFQIAGISQLDYLDLYKNYSLNDRESYSLNYISSIELNREKTKFNGSLNDLWKTDWAKFVEYNINDVLLVKELEAKLGYLLLVQSQSYACKIPFEKHTSSIKKFDNYLMSILKEKKIVVPTAIRNSEEELPGGYVSEPKVGYYKNIVSYDFTSLYPHIIMALNISPETYIGRIKGNYTDIDLSKIEDSTIYNIGEKETTGSKLKEFIIKNSLILSPNGTLYKSTEGFIPKIIKELFVKRQEYKKIMQREAKLYDETKKEEHLFRRATYDSFQYNTKILLNSAFGILANPNYRFYNINSASSITLMGQKIIKYTAEKINSFFKEKFQMDSRVVIYSDTDSCFCDYTPVVEKMKIEDKDKLIQFVELFDKKYLEPYLTTVFKEYSSLHNISKNYFDLKREIIGIGSIFLQKKKYALYIIYEEGRTLPQPKLKIKGMEIIRSSTPSFCRSKIKEVVELLFISNRNKRLLIDEVLKFKKEFMRLEDISEIAFPRGINELKSYMDSIGNPKKACPIHCRAAINYNKLLKKFGLEKKYNTISNTDKIKFIYIIDKNPVIKENIIGFKEILPEEFGLNKWIDRELQFEKSFMSPIKTIFTALGWDINTESVDITNLFA